MQILGQIVVVAPDDSANWLRLAKSVLLIRPGNDRERTLLLERAATAAYIAYQRSTGNAGEEADSAGGDRAQLRRPLALASGARCAAHLARPARSRGGAAAIRADARGIRLPAARLYGRCGCRFAAGVLPVLRGAAGKRIDFSPFVAVAGQDRPAITAQEQQLCVEGLKHGERYAITLRAGIPSLVKETLAKTAEFNVYVRDRKPIVRFTGKSYVLPRVGQRGIPVVSVNTSALAIEIYRIGDRNLVDTVDRARLPAQPRPLRRRAADRGARRAGLEGRDEGRAGAQCRRHHRVPGRRGDPATLAPAST